MADTVFNIAKGKVAYYATLPAANDALILIPLETTGLESDAVIQDYDTVALVLAAATNEQTTMGRKTATGVTVTADDTNDRIECDFDDPLWTTVSPSNAVSRLLVAYDPDTTGGTDADLIPLVLLDFVATPAGGNIAYAVNANGFFRAS